MVNSKQSPLNRSRRISRQPAQLLQLTLGEIAPLACWGVELDVHDADALQTRHLKLEVFAHAANLSVEALREDDAKRAASDFLYYTRTRDGVENGNTR